MSDILITPIIIRLSEYNEFGGSSLFKYRISNKETKYNYETIETSFERSILKLNYIIGASDTGDSRILQTIRKYMKNIKDISFHERQYQIYNLKDYYMIMSGFNLVGINGEIYIKDLRDLISDSIVINFFEMTESSLQHIQKSGGQLIANIKDSQNFKTLLDLIPEEFI